MRHAVTRWLLAALAISCGARSDLPVAPEPTEVPRTCGDRLPQTGEACDDGNTIETDDCLSDCHLASCGDGVVRTGFEPCDDGNGNDGDACRNNCSLPSCGDGVVQPPEECDDGNGIDTDACPALCLAARCGDGFVQAGLEECDLGPANRDSPALVLTQGQLEQAVRPVQSGAAALSFYSYVSKSAHTGFEELRQSRLFVFRDPATSGLSLFSFHGIDIDSTGVVQPKSFVRQLFEGVPAQAFVVLTDDNENEFFPGNGGGIFRGDWEFETNTDGGIIGGIPFPSSWSIDVTSDFQQGVDGWSYVDGTGTFISLERDETATLTAFDDPSECRKNCTIPRCGDGILDAGEACDDGNTVDGDGCSSSCL